MKADDALFGNAPKGRLLVLVAQYYTTLSLTAVSGPAGMCFGFSVFVGFRLIFSLLND